MIKNKYVILGTQRCGSFLLNNIITKNYSDNIICLGEIYNRDKEFWDFSYNYYPNNYNIRYSKPIDYLNSIEDHYNDYNKDFLFKLIIPTFNFDILSHIGKSTNYTKIILKRKNILSQYISQKISVKNNIWRSFENCENLSPVVFDYMEFIEYHKYYIIHYNLLENFMRGRLYTLYYDELLNTKNLSIMFEQLFGYTPLEYYEKEIKKISKNKIDEVENYDEMKRILKDTEYNWMIENLNKEIS